MSPALNEAMSERLEHIDKGLAQALEDRSEPRELYDPVRHAINSGGKRLRPILTIMTAEALGTPAKQAMSAAIAVELMHTFTLVHDDIMDRSDLRRGKPTVRCVFGDSAAILAGDVMLGIALEILLKDLPAEANFVDVFREFSVGLRIVCEGQALDMAHSTSVITSSAGYEEMIYRKTARLLEMAVALGALIANASATQIIGLRSYGSALGMAFQMKDDLLDIIGDARTGKIPGGDLVEGKHTLPILIANERATNAHHRMLLDAFFANRGLERRFLDDFKVMLHDLDVVTTMQERIEHYTQISVSSLEQLPSTPGTNLLSALALRLLGRVE